MTPKINVPFLNFLQKRMFKGEAHDETGAVGVLRIVGECAIHQHDNTAAKEQSETKSLGKHIELGELLEDEVGLVGRYAGACVFDGEFRRISSGFDTHGYATLGGGVEGIDEQFCEGDEQMMTVGLNGQFIVHMTVELHLCGMGYQTAGVLKCLARHVVAANGVCQTDGLPALNQ